MKGKVIHIKSKQRGKDGKSPKLPTSSQIQYGEIAINYGEGIETIAILNENDEIVRFVPERKVYEIVEQRIQELMKELPFQDMDDNEASIDSGEY